MSVNPFSGYVQVKVGNIPASKLEKSIKGQAIRLTNANLTGDRVMLVHPLNAKAIKKAQMSGKGLATTFSTGEALADIDFHDRAGGSISGGSLWSWLKNKAWPWVKKNWNIIKPVASAVADVAIPALSAAVGAPTAGPMARGALKQLTGVGIEQRSVRPPKGSQAMKDKMTALRAKRKGGSFRTA